MAEFVIIGGGIYGVGAAKHQSLLHFIDNSPWSNVMVLAKVREQVLPTTERHGPIRACIIETGAACHTGVRTCFFQSLEHLFFETADGVQQRSINPL